MLVGPLGHRSVRADALVDRHAQTAKHDGDDSAAVNMARQRKLP